MRITGTPWSNTDLALAALLASAPANVKAQQTTGSISGHTPPGAEILIANPALLILAVFLIHRRHRAGGYLGAMLLLYAALNRVLNPAMPDPGNEGFVSGWRAGELSSAVVGVCWAYAIVFSRKAKTYFSART